ncbi:hypothetical protein F0562_016985 [Nyssa sinensis]|uniref:Uncharacterized protein n=1 Tax=Nyssa sinensis TaxID=561372 RepID=A0A5J4ZEV0_9ASTE|nr:hypothetical protein F0562_016985 [Nyssa sinensis]
MQWRGVLPGAGPRLHLAIHLTIDVLGWGGIWLWRWWIQMLLVHYCRVGSCTLKPKWSTQSSSWHAPEILTDVVSDSGAVEGNGGEGLLHLESEVDERQLMGL